MSELEQEQVLSEEHSENETKLDTGGSLFLKVVKGEDKKAADCPKNHVPMVAMGTRRIGCVSGRVYIFSDGKTEFVHKDDRDEVAAKGASNEEVKQTKAKQ